MAPPAGKIREVVQLYARAARHALEASFDRVEIRAAIGHLVTQSISAHAHRRADRYGSSLRGRLRFLREVIEAVAAMVVPDRLGVRFTPPFTGADQDRIYIALVEDDPCGTYLEAVKVLEQAGAAYVSIAEADWDDANGLPAGSREDLRRAFGGPALYAGRYTAERAAPDRGWASSRS